jgi:hypothetical protein
LAERSPLTSRDRPSESQFINPWNHRGWITYFTQLLPRFQYVRFLGLPNLEETPDVPLDQLYVPLDLAPTPLSPTEVENARRRPAYDVLAEERWMVVLGDPGAGKSTLVNYLTTTLASRGSGPVHQALGALIPVPIILRDYAIDEGITFEGILDQFIRQPFWPDSLTLDDLIGVLEAGQALVMLDGLDEIGDVERRRSLRSAILGVNGVLRFPACSWLLTSRIVGYDDVVFDLKGLARNPSSDRAIYLDYGARSASSGATSFYAEVTKLSSKYDPDIQILASIERSWYICPFSSDQIRRYLENWYAFREQDQARRTLSIQSLMNAIQSTPSIKVLAHNPNLLTMMALIHRVFAELPSGRALLYDKIVEAYLKSIDTFRGIRESAIDPRVQERWLGELAYDMQRERASGDREKPGASTGSSEGEILVPAEQVETKIRKILGPDHNAAAELNYIGRRSGLLLPRKPGFYCFVHLSFQEYFAACHLLDRLMGFGSRAAALDEVAGLVDSSAWHETLIFLFEKLAVITNAADDVFQNCFQESREITPASALLAANLLGDLNSGLSQERRADAVRFILRHARGDASRSLINCINDLPAAIWSETFLPLLRIDLAQGSPPTAPFLLFLQSLSPLSCDQAETLLSPILKSIPESDLFYLHPLSGKGDGPVRQELSLRLPLRDWFRILARPKSTFTRWFELDRIRRFFFEELSLPLFGFLDRDTTWLQADRATILSWACAVHVLLQECLHAKLVLALAHSRTKGPRHLRAFPGVVDSEGKTGERFVLYRWLYGKPDFFDVGYAYAWMIQQRPEIGGMAEVSNRLSALRYNIYNYAGLIKDDSETRVLDFARFLLDLADIPAPLHLATSSVWLAQASLPAWVAFGLMKGIDGIKPLGPESTPAWARPLKIVRDQLAELVLGRGGSESWRAIQQQVDILKDPAWIGSTLPSVTEEEWGDLLELLGLRGKGGGALFEAEWFADGHVFAAILNARPSEFVARLRELGKTGVTDE